MMVWPSVGRASSCGIAYRIVTLCGRCPLLAHVEASSTSSDPMSDTAEFGVKVEIRSARFTNLSEAAVLVGPSPGADAPAWSRAFLQAASLSRTAASRSRSPRSGPEFDGVLPAPVVEADAISIASFKSASLRLSTIQLSRSHFSSSAFVCCRASSATRFDKAFVVSAFAELVGKSRALSSSYGRRSSSENVCQRCFSSSSSAAVPSLSRSATH